MMHKEFEELAGYEVSYETYTNIIEPMYTALPDNITKAQFVKMLDKKAFALPDPKKMIREMRKLAEQIAEVVEHNGAYELKSKLEKLSHEYYKRVYEIDWNNDIQAYCFMMTKTTMPNGRGCSYPVELVMGYGHQEYARIKLIKE